MPKPPKGFEFIGPPPYEHQIETLLFAKRRKGKCGILLDMGLGKTKCAIDISRWFLKKDKKITHILVVCPTGVMFSWQRQIKTFSEQEATVLKGPKSKRIEMLKKNNSTFYIINYEMLMPLLKHLLAKKFDIIIYDESAKFITNPRAKRTQAAIELADNAYHKLILTGTPIEDTPVDLWAQFRVIDKYIFGPNFYTYLNTNFHKQVIGGKFVKYRIKSDMYKKAISRMIKKYCFRKTKEECFDLPQKIYDKIEVEMSEDLKRMYKKVASEVSAEIQTEAGKRNLTSQFILTKLIRLQQITAGFIKDDKGKEIKLADTPKLDALIEQIEIIVQEKSSVIVWCRFLKSMDLIRETLHKKGIECLTLSGRDSNKKDDIWQEFQNSDIPVFIGQLKAGGVGIELFKKNSTSKNQYCFFYENLWTPGVRQQAEDRIHRIGQRSTCVYKDIVLKGTIDEIILDRIRQKQSVIDWIMEEDPKYISIT